MSNGIPKQADQLEATLENHILNCPILHDKMEDPVVAADGHTYERAAILGWIESKGARATSPMTGQPLAHLNVETNHLVKSLIQVFAETAPARKLKELTASDLSIAIKLREEELEGMLAKQSEQISKAETELEDSGARYEKMRKRLNQAREEQSLKGNIGLEDSELQGHLSDLVKTAQKQDEGKLGQHLASNILKRWFSQKLASKKLKEQPYLHTREEALLSALSDARLSHESKMTSQEEKQAKAMSTLEESDKSAVNEIRTSIREANERDDDDAIDNLQIQRTELKKRHKEKKAALLSQHNKETIDTEKVFHQEVKPIEKELEEVRGAKKVKHAHMNHYAEQIKKQTEVIVAQHRELLSERSQLEEMAKAFYGHASNQKSKAETSREREEARRLYMSKAEAQRVGLFKPLAPELDEAELNEFLNHVALGEQDEADAMLKATPALVLGKGTCKDHAGRTFKEISGFQYSLWALDWHMWDMILPFFDQLPEGKAASREQCQSQEGLTEGLGHGPRYKMEDIVNALKTYVDQFDALYKVENWNELQRLWIHVVGKAQAQTVAHVAQEYCHPDRPFDPVPDFNAKPFKRQFNTDEGE